MSREPPRSQSPEVTERPSEEGRCFPSAEERTKGQGEGERADGWAKILTPELVVVAAALGLPAAVSGLADVALVVGALAVQQTLQDTSTVPFYPLEERIYNVSAFKIKKDPNGSSDRLASLRRTDPVLFFTQRKLN